MSLNPAGMKKSYAWNYSNNQKEGYSEELIGTVAALQEVQASTFNPNGPGMPAFWDDGKPKMNIRIWLIDATGEYKFLTFSPASRAAREGKKRSLHIDLFALTGNTDMRNLIGKTIKIATQPGTYGSGNPRPWSCELMEAGPFTATEELPAEARAEKVLANASAHGGQTVAPQMPQPQYPQGYGMAPQMQMPQQQMYQQPQPQPMYQQPMSQQQYPQGMDPNVASAMQNMGATNVSVYDENLPF